LKNDQNQEYFLSMASWKSKLSRWTGKKIILGIRPEHVSDSILAHNGNTKILELESNVKVTEPTGPDTLVFVSLNGTDVTCRVHPEAAHAPGENMPLMMDMAKSILFDPETEIQL
jgi:multiple sugar transport system ATP-binding protein